MMHSVLLVAGVGVLSFALRAFRHPLPQRLGTLGIFATSFLAGWLIGGSAWLGLLFAALWLLLPWLEILTQARRMRLPIERALQSRTPPTRQAFPNFGELSDEAEADGFEYMEDAGWNHEDHAHFFRLFYNEKERMQASICLVEQGEFAFYYLALTTRAADGRTFITWNYPFSYGLQLPPRMHLNRAVGEMGFAELRERHAAFLQTRGVSTEQIPAQNADTLKENLQTDMRDQIFHNLQRGLLARDGEKLIRYTPRGMFFLWFQFLRDLVRLS